MWNDAFVLLAAQEVVEVGKPDTLDAVQRLHPSHHFERVLRMDCVRDLTLTKSLFITNFVQFNSQNDNININARLQWRFKPVSDFFIVYTDNYFYSFDDDMIRDFAPRTRALVFKLTYWLNL